MFVAIAIGLVILWIFGYLSYVLLQSKLLTRRVLELASGALTKSAAAPALIAAQVLADLGPVIASESDLEQTAASALGLMMSSAHAKAGALFCLQETPPLLASVASAGFAFFPATAVFPLTPRQVDAINQASGPQRLSGDHRDSLLSSNGNISNRCFRILVPLRVQGKLFGALMLGDPHGATDYPADVLHQLGGLAPFVALAIRNHQLALSLRERDADQQQQLIATVSTWDGALEAFATTIDAKNQHTHGHSLRVGRYAAGIAEALGMDADHAGDVRAAGYLHDIGKVVVDQHIFDKTGTLSPNELLEMANHTLVGHEIVTQAQFPWPKVPEVVRSHHERADGSGYPDHLHSDEVSTTVKIVAVADTFDAILSDRPYREKMPLGRAMAHMCSLAPLKLDSEVVHALLIQLRRDALTVIPGRRSAAEGGEDCRKTFLDPDIASNISPTDIDVLMAEMQRRLTRGRASAS